MTSAYYFLDICNLIKNSIEAKSILLTKLIFLQVKYKKHKKTNKTTGAGGGMGGGGNVGGVNGSGSLTGNKGTMGTSMLEKHMAAAAAHHSQQQQHSQLAGNFLHHHRISSGDSINSQPTSSHPSHNVHTGHLVNGTILKTALTNPSEVSTIKS